MRFFGSVVIWSVSFVPVSSHHWSYQYEGARRISLIQPESVAFRFSAFRGLHSWCALQRSRSRPDIAGCCIAGVGTASAGSGGLLCGLWEPALIGWDLGAWRLLRVATSCLTAGVWCPSKSVGIKVLDDCALPLPPAGFCWSLEPVQVVGD